MSTGAATHHKQTARSPGPVLSDAIGRVMQAGDRPMRAAFLARALNALARLTPELGERALGQAAGAPSDYAVLLYSLEDPAAVGVLQAEDPLIEARLRGLTMRERLVQAEGGVLRVEQVAKHLGLTRQAVDKRRRSGKLLALDTGRRGYAYPSWQLGPRGTLPGFEQILADLNVQDPWMQVAFFLSGDPRLNGATPLEELRRGNVEGVRRAARGYGEHGAA